MAYLLADVEVTAPLPELVLKPDNDGVGLVVRRRQRPIGFVLQALPPGSALSATDVARLIQAAEQSAGSSDLDEPPAPVVNDRLPSLTAAVCTRDRPAQLARCLASLVALHASRWADPVRFELLVVDNAPSDQRARDVVAGFQGVRYVYEPIRGLDFARNRVLREARGDFVAFFDDDVTVDPRWLEGFAEAWSANPDAAAVTGPVLPYELETRAQVLFEEYGGFGHRFRKLRYEPTRADDPLYPCSPGQIGAGCNMTVRRDVVCARGGFDEALDTGAPLPGGGDLDIFYRILRAGFPIVTEPQCLVFHQHRRSYVELRYQMWTWGLSYMAFVGKSYRTDPHLRPRFRRVVARWFFLRLVHAAFCTIGRGGRPAGLAFAHLVGGVVGLFGEYARSERRIRRLLVEAGAPAL